MNLGACAGLKLGRERGTWFRGISLQHISTPLSYAHTKVTASRFSPGYVVNPPDQFSVLYLADDMQVALFEMGALLGPPFRPGATVSNPRIALAVLNVDVDLQHVADLTDPIAVAQLETTTQELTGDWRGYQYRQSGVTPVHWPTGLAPTQELGWKMFWAGFEAFRSVSARVSSNRTLVIFPDNLSKGSEVTFYHSNGSVVAEIKGSK